MAIEDYGIKVSKFGYSVFTAAPKDQAFNSSYNNFKIILQGAVSVHVPTSGGATHIISHALGYTPAFLVFGQLSSDKTILIGSTDPLGLGEAFNAKATTADLIIDFDSNGVAGYTAHLYYYIIADPAL